MDIRSGGVISLIAFMVAGGAAASELNPEDFVECYLASEECIDDEPREINGRVVARGCWEYQHTYVCYGEPQSETCDLQAMEASSEWRLAGTDNQVFPDFGEYAERLPIAWTEEWITTDAVCDGSTDFGCGPVLEAEDLGDGRVAETRRCYVGETPRCLDDPDCTVIDFACTDTLDGLCVTQRQTYRCVRDGDCPPSDGEIVPKVPDGEGAFDKALAAAGLMDQVAEHGSWEDGQFRIFSGEERECRNITSNFRTVVDTYAAVATAVSSFFGGWFGGAVAGAIGSTISEAVSSMRCCQSDPGDVEVGASFGYCDQDDVQLAAARLGDRAVQVTPGSVDTDNTFCLSYATMLPNSPARGSMSNARQICSHWSRPDTLANTQIQVDRYQRWCEFDSILARLIQEQGREQLAELAATSAGGAETGNAVFDFYGEGAWTDAVVVNGNNVRFWQWREACADPEVRAEAAVSGQDCPSAPDVFVAVCDSEECGPPPSHPQYDYVPAWEVHRVPAEDHGLRALNRYTVLQGGCFEDGGCEYEVHAWPAGTGGQLRIPVDMEWPLRFPEPGWDQFTWAHNNVHFQAYVHDPDAETAEPRLRMCVGALSDCDAGGWQELDVPDPVQDLEHRINDEPPVTLVGSCDEENCRYRATIEVQLTAKPWYTYSQDRYRPCMVRVLGSCVSRARTTYNRQYDPDCSGFTLEEFMALDLGRMDLSDYVDTLSEEARREFERVWAQ